MKLFQTLTGTVILWASVATGAQVAQVSAQQAEPATQMHRYLIERNFAEGALAKADAAKIIRNNKAAQVHWVKSYVNADKTKTFCIYEGPSKAAVREAAELNNLPVESITEIPATLSPPPG